jgi:hypothetical protein
MPNTKKRKKVVQGEIVPRLAGTGRGLDSPRNDDLRARLREQLEKQHAVHAVFGIAFEEVGGVERLIDWAEDNYDKFIAIFSKMAPTKEGAGSGKIQIQINNRLGPGPLDQ